MSGRGYENIGDWLQGGHKSEPIRNLLNFPRDIKKGIWMMGRLKFSHCFHFKRASHAGTNRKSVSMYLFIPNVLLVITIGIPVLY